MPVDPNSYNWNWRSSDFWIEQDGTLQIRISNLGDAETIRAVLAIYYRSRTDLFCDWKKMIAEPLDLKGENLSFDNGDIGFHVYTREQCRAEILKSLTTGSGVGCQGFPRHEQRKIRMPWTLGDPRNYILLADINCLNNADPAGVRILTSPSGLPPAFADLHAPSFAMPKA